MSCQEISMAEQYVDGELDVTEQSRYEKHLSTCTVCQQEVDSLRELLTGLRALSAGEAPQTSWEDIVFQLQVAPPEDVALEEVITLEHPDEQDVELGLSELPVEVTPAHPKTTRQLYALSGWVVALGVLLFFVWSPRPQKRAPQHRHTLHRAVKRPTQTQAQRDKVALAKVMGRLHQVAAHYEKALKDLSVLAEKKLKGESHRVQMLRQTLATIDKAIEECRDMIKVRPEALGAHKVLHAMYQRKVDLLRDIVLGEI